MQGITRILSARDSEIGFPAIISAMGMIIADTTILISRKGMVMGDIGYIYGYSLAFVFFVGGLVGFVIGRWFSE